MASQKRARIPKDLAYQARLQLSPLLYAREVLQFKEYPWQADILSSPSKRVEINGARQIGKSTVVGIPPTHRARWYPNSLWIVGAATEDQANEDMLKIKQFISMDPDFPEYVREGADLLTFKNGARIVVVPATEKAGGRAYSNPDGITLDEDSRITDSVYRSSVRPLLTHNKKCVLYLLSTPNGRQGHFYRASRSPSWMRFEIRSPFEPDDVERTLQQYIPEAEYKAKKLKEGIRAYYSPRHYDLDEQQENLDEMGPRMYRQEECCEFVESEDQVFSNADISAMYDDQAEFMTFGSAAERSDDVEELVIRPRGARR